MGKKKEKLQKGVEQTRKHFEKALAKGILKPRPTPVRPKTVWDL